MTYEIEEDGVGQVIVHDGMGNIVVGKPIFVTGRSVGTNERPWQEFMDVFVQNLRGLGYIIGRKNLINYINESETINE
jgi:hypothetical protein